MPEHAEKVYREPLKREIINGKVYLMAGASTGHDDVVGNLRIIFGDFLRGKPCKLYGESANVYFDENSPEVLPDLKIVCDRSKIYKGKIKNVGIARGSVGFAFDIEDNRHYTAVRNFARAFADMRSGVFGGAF